MISLAMVFIAFTFGSFPFSVWLGKLLLGVDVRQYGDGNPGAANVFLTGNKLVGVVSLILDVSKAAAPVGFAYFNMGIRGTVMALIAIAPILGHVFSPFLHFRGGKALAVALGVWIGLTIWKASLVGVIGTVVGIALMTSSGWAVMLGLAMILITLLLWIPDPLLLMVWVSEMLILAWTHRYDLRQRPELRSWLTRRFIPKS
ncbi:MAG: glycerol-3-phosphate acyltransferase [Anaerolineales bacterium]